LTPNLRGAGDAYGIAAEKNKKNRLLSSLFSADLAELYDDLQFVDLTKHQIVFEVGAALNCIYFIEEGLASVLTIMEDSRSIEAGMVGRKGAIGLSALLGGCVSEQQVIMHLAGSALRVTTAARKAAFDSNARIRAVLLRFIGDTLSLSSQLAGCNRLRSIEQRSARWR
jgi:CRP-like cAMP-binding protein